MLRSPNLAVQIAVLWSCGAVDGKRYGFLRRYYGCRLDNPYINEGVYMDVFHPYNNQTVTCINIENIQASWVASR